jgi:hypothetical protein
MSRRIGRLTRVAVACAAAVGVVTALGVRTPDRADAAGGVVFGGVSGQKKPVIVQVNARRTRVVRVYWDWHATCSLGPAAPAGTPLTTAWGDMAERFAINARGRWSGSYSTGPFPNATTGVTQRFGDRLTGGLLTRGARMVGTIRATYTETSAAGLIRACNSGLIRFNIRD